MSDGYDGVAANRIKHMELIQAVISRLANNSFLIKGWAVTVASAFLGLAVSRSEARLAWIALAPVILFWGLDAYFLYAERLFRGLYDQVRKSNPNVEPFYMAATSDTFVGELESVGASDLAFTDALWRPAVWVFHFALVLATVLVALLLGNG
jgi:hypothetical protein